MTGSGPEARAGCMGSVVAQRFEADVLVVGGGVNGAGIASEEPPFMASPPACTSPGARLGSRIEHILAGAMAVQDLGAEIAPDLYYAELDSAEWATEAEDDTARFTLIPTPRPA